MRTLLRDADFEAFVRSRRGQLVATATALTAGDRHLAEDLVQLTLIRMYAAWPRAIKRGGVDAYARRILVNNFIDHRRRPFIVRETVTPEVPDRPFLPSQEAVDADLLAALAAMPKGMRAVVVLRHVLDLSVEETSDALGCSIGNVKSQNARGLARLRELLLPVSVPPTKP